MRKDYDGLCQHSESLWASRPPVHNWLTSVNACVRWWLFNTINAFGLKDVGFITLKPFSVMAVNNWLPTPFSKMSTNTLRTLSNTLISLKVRKQLWKQVLLHLWSMQHISNRNSDVPFALILCCLTTHDFSFVNGLIFQSEPYRMTRLIQTMQLFMFCELSTFKLNWSWERSTEIEQKWWLRLMLLCIFDLLPSWQLSGEVFKRTIQRLQCWICSSHWDSTG